MSFRVRLTLGLCVLVAVCLMLTTSPPAASRSIRPLASAPQTPIEHVIIIHKENRSFDTYFGKYPGANGATTGELHDGTVIDLLPARDSLPSDIGHSEDDWKLAYNDGQMNGFDLERGALKNGFLAPYQQFTESQIPSYWAYARRYGLGDNTFASFKGASLANNLFRVAAQSGREEPSQGFRAASWNPVGVTLGPTRWGCDEPPDYTAQTRTPTENSRAYPCFTFRSLPNVLSEHGVTWHYYAKKSDPSFILNTLDAIASVRYDPSLWANMLPLDDFVADVEAGTLPSVSWVQPIHNDHPNKGSVCEGENEAVRYINAVMQSPLWSSSVIIMTWDEWGGFYDHVRPPQIDDISFGFRYPMLVISPFVKYGSGSDGGYVNSTFFSHSSPLALVERNWDLPPLTTHDAESNDMMDFFDFDQVPKAPLIRQERNCPPLSPAARRFVQNAGPDDAD